jgi:hypothetical protein
MPLLRAALQLAMVAPLPVLPMVAPLPLLALRQQQVPLQQCHALPSVRRLGSGLGRPASTR